VFYFAGHEPFLLLYPKDNANVFVWQDSFLLMTKLLQ